MEELRQWLGTRVHNHLSLLLRRGEMRRFSWAGRPFIPRLTPPARNSKRPRGNRRRPKLQDRRPRTGPVCPPGMEAMDLIRLLLVMLQKPAASPASLAKSLQAQGLAIPADRVRQVMAFYGLKKRHPEDRLPSCVAAAIIGGSAWEAVRIPTASVTV